MSTRETDDVVDLPATPDDSADVRSTAAFPWIWVLLCCAAVAAAIAWAIRVDHVPVQPRALLPEPVVNGSRVVLNVPGHVLAGRVATYKDELFAYLMFNHLRHNSAFANGTLYLTFDPRDPVAPYRLVFRASDDLLSAIPATASLVSAGTLIPSSLRLVPLKRI